MARKPAPRKSLKDRTPIAEWLAASVGLVLTLSVIGYSVWEGVRDGDDRPALTVEAGPAEPAGGRFLVPITVRNQAHATAGAVEIHGVLKQGATLVEERRAAFTYVPGKGASRGGLVFEHDPRGYALTVTPEGYEEP
jgi:uncharacterized protein (TIGR02588 family)